MHSGLRVLKVMHVLVSAPTQIFDFGKSPSPPVFCFFNGISSKIACMMSWHSLEAMRQKCPSVKYNLYLCMKCLCYLDLNLGISFMLETNTIMNWHSEDPKSISFLTSIKLLCLIYFMIHNSLFAFQRILKFSTKDYSPNPLETQVLYNSFRYQGFLDILWGSLNN